MQARLTARGREGATIESAHQGEAVTLDATAVGKALELGAARVMSKDASVEKIFAAIREFGGLPGGD